MRSVHRWMIWIALSAALAVGLLAGCPGQPEPEVTAGVGPEEPADAGVTPEGSAPSTEAAPSTGQVSKLGDVLARMPQSFAATVTMTSADGQSQSMSIAMQMRDGQPLRMKSAAAEEQGVLVVDYEAKKMYSWDSAKGEGVVLPLSDVEANAPENPYADVDPEREITGSEVIDGVECWIAEMTNDQGQTVTTWYAKADGLVRKVTIDGTTITYAYSQIGEVPDSEFAVPEGISLTDMSDMPGMPTGG